MFNLSSKSLIEFARPQTTGNAEYRAYSLRKQRATPAELESRAKVVVAKAKTRSEAMRILQRDGFRADEAERHIARFFKPHQTQQQQLQQQQVQSVAKQTQPQVLPPQRRKTPVTPQQHQPKATPLTTRDQHVDLIAFSHNVSDRLM